MTKPSLKYGNEAPPGTLGMPAPRIRDGTAPVSASRDLFGSKGHRKGLLRAGEDVLHEVTSKCHFRYLEEPSRNRQGGAHFLVGGLCCGRVDIAEIWADVDRLPVVLRMWDETATKLPVTVVVVLSQW